MKMDIQIVQILHFLRSSQHYTRYVGIGYLQTYRFTLAFWKRNNSAPVYDDH